MGLLAYNPYDPRQNPMLRNVTPFVAPQLPEGQGSGPPLAPPAPPPSQAPMPQPNRMQSAWQGLLGTGGLKPGASLQERMNAVADGPLFNTGMALIAASAPGATGADFVNQMQNYRQGQLQREQMRRQEWRENRADKQNDVAFGRQQTEWNRQDEQRAAWQAAVNNEQDPNNRQRLLAMGPEGYGQYITARENRDWQAQQAELDRNAQIRAAGISANARERPRPMTPQFRTNVRSQFETARQLRDSYTNFIEMVRNADTPTLMGVGPRGAALAAQQRLLAIQAKSPAALDLGALVGADFAILDDIIGNPQNWRQLVQSGGREGVVERLRPFDTFMNQGMSRLRGTYQDYADEFPEYYQNEALPNEAPPATSPAPARLEPGLVIDGYRYRGGDPNDRRNWVPVGQSRAPVAARGQRPGAF